jgi:hypothetical protein
MFPGYALTYYEQEKNCGLQKLQFKDYVAHAINQFSTADHNDTIDLSINSNERVDFFYQETDSNQDEPFRVNDVSVIMFKQPPSPQKVALARHASG